MITKKLYCYTTVIAWGIIIVALLVGMLVPVILFPKDTWFLIIGIFLLLLSLWYLISIGFFFPIIISESTIKYRGKKYNWEDVKITAYPALRKSPQYGYFLVFGQQYLFDEELKKQIRSGFWVYLKEKSLNQILEFYKNQILIVDEYGNKDEINSSKKINAIIRNHNEKN